jgi:hypothetical protein
MEIIRSKFLLQRLKPQNLRRSLVAHLNEKFGVGWLNESLRSPAELETELNSGPDVLRRAIGGAGILA